VLLGLWSGREGEDRMGQLGSLDGRYMLFREVGWLYASARMGGKGRVTLCSSLENKSVIMYHSTEGEGGPSYLP